MAPAWRLAAACGVTALVAVSALGGCYGGGAFSCSEDSQCGINGRCEPNHLCSFADPTCASGFRYGDGAGSLSGFCVGEEPVDASMEPDSPGPDIDGPTGGADASCVVDGLDLCEENPPDSAITFGNETLNTDSDSRCRDTSQPGGGDHLCL